MAGIDDKLVALYVRLNPKKLRPVTKFGTTSFIAAERTAGENSIQYYPDRVVAILHDDFRRHRGDYMDAIKSDHLHKVPREEYEKSLNRKAEQKRTKASDTKNLGKKKASKKSSKPATTNNDETGAQSKD